MILGKLDERQLLKAIYDNNINPRYVLNNILQNINNKRAWYILSKWANKGWYDYGVCIDLGWLTKKGKEIAKQIQDK